MGHRDGSELGEDDAAAGAGNVEGAGQGPPLNQKLSHISFAKA